MEPITIIMTVWFIDKQRKQAAENTLQSWNDRLMYEGDIHLHVADDGSTLKWKPEKFWKRSEITYSRQERHGVGASLNAGIKKAHTIFLYMVDDWSLSQSFDITPWVQVLTENNNLGIVRLGPPHPDMTGTIKMFTTNWQGWGLLLNRHHFAIGHRPQLIHQRLIEYYGWFDEDTSALECERLYNQRWVEDRNGPGAILALPHPFIHSGSESVSDLDIWKK
jgi:hypothetical protein